MAGWIVWSIFGVLLLAVAVLFLPWYVSVRYATGEAAAAYVRWLVFRVRISPKRLLKKDGQKRRKGAVQKVKKVKKKRRRKEQSQKKKMTPEEVMQIVTMALEGLKKGQGGLRQIFRCFQLSRIELTAVVATGDAANTAIAYGRLSGAVYVAVGLMHSLWRMRDPDIRISADFLGESSRMYGYVAGRVIPGAALIGAIRLSLALLTVYLRGKKEEKDHESNRKQLHSAPH